MTETPLLNVFGAKLSKNGQHIVLVLVTGENENRQFYNACISLDETAKANGYIDEINNEAVIRVNLLDNKPSDTPFDTKI